jgi:hypothetical protein
MFCTPALGNNPKAVELYILQVISQIKNETAGRAIGENPHKVLVFDGA